MEILILTILFILLLKRVKETPSDVSKKIWYKKTLEWVDQLKMKSYDHSIMLWSCVMTLIVVIFLIGFYVYIGCLINIKAITILSALKILSCLNLTWLGISECESLLSCNIEDYKFHRASYLFSVIVDYAYYLSTIYMIINYVV